MRKRAVPLLIPLSIAAAGLTVAARADVRPDAGHPIVVSDVRVPAAEVFERGRTGPSAGNRAVEERWLRGELGRPGPAALRHLRAAVADSLARGADTPAAFGRAFEDFHARWRERTECLPAVHDPVMDRCANLAPSPDGTCRWMGEATVCSVNGGRRRVWLLLTPGRGRRILSRRAAALRSAQAAYRESLAARTEAARGAAADLASAAGAQGRALRLAQPFVSPAGARALHPACRRYAADIDLYMLGALQDPAGWADGVRSARRRFAAAVREARLDAIDAPKAERLARRMPAGSAALGDLPRFLVQAREDQRMAAQLGLGDKCLPVPGD